MFPRTAPVLQIGALQWGGSGLTTRKGSRTGSWDSPRRRHRAHVDEQNGELNDLAARTARKSRDGSGNVVVGVRVPTGRSGEAGQDTQRGHAAGVSARARESATTWNIGNMDHSIPKTHMGNTAFSVAQGLAAGHRESHRDPNRFAFDQKLHRRVPRFSRQGTPRGNGASMVASMDDLAHQRGGRGFGKARLAPGQRCQHESNLGGSAFGLTPGSHTVSHGSHGGSSNDRTKGRARPVAAHRSNISGGEMGLTPHASVPDAPVSSRRTAIPTPY